MNEKTKIARIATIEAIVKEANIIVEDVKTTHVGTKKKVGEWILNAKTNLKPQITKRLTDKMIEMDGHASTLEQMATYTRHNLEVAKSGDADALYFAAGNYAEFVETLSSFEDSITEIYNLIKD